MSEITSVTKMVDRLHSERTRLLREVARADEMVQRGTDAKKNLLRSLEELNEALDDLTAVDEAPETKQVLSAAKQRREEKRANNG
jgi:outer membrane protein assembly factor BamD (BamD/ComL family)